MSSKKKKNISRYVKEARTAAVLYGTAKTTLPIGEDAGRQVGYAGFVEKEDGKKQIYIKTADQEKTAEAYGLDLYTIAELKGPMSLVGNDYDNIPLDVDTEYDDNRNELRMNLGKLLDSI